jgi:hypothetical protein
MFDINNLDRVSVALEKIRTNGELLWVSMFI